MKAVKSDTAFQKEGYKETKLGWIPENWEVKFLNEIGDFSKGKGIAKKDVLEIENDGLPCVRYAEIYTLYHYNTSTFISKTNKTSAENSNPINYGDILFAGSGETLEDIGKSVAYLGKQTAYAGGDIIILKQKNQDSKFLGYLLNNDVVKNQLFKLGQGHSVVHIYSSGLKKVLVPLPPLPEQQKIASILNTWDKAIATQEQLIAQKQELKKGLMQELLTGKKRFDGFEEEWREVRLGDFCEFTQGVQIPYSEQIDTIKEGFIRYLYIRDFFSNDFACYVVNNYPSKIMNENDIMMVNTGNTAGKVFKGAYGVLSNNAFKISPKKGLTNEFLYYLLSSNFTQLKIQSFFNYGGQPHVGHKNVARIPIKVPSNDEQLKIVSVIDKFQLELEKMNDSLSKIKEQKQGLMQQLLTGAKRVKV